MFNFGNVINFHHTVNYGPRSINHKTSIYYTVSDSCHCWLVLPFEASEPNQLAPNVVLVVCINAEKCQLFCVAICQWQCWLRQIMLYGRAINRHFSCFDSFPWSAPMLVGIVQTPLHWKWLPTRARFMASFAILRQDVYLCSKQTVPRNHRPCMY